MKPAVKHLFLLVVVVTASTAWLSAGRQTETDRKYGSYCRSISYNILGSREDAEECVNDAMMCATARLISLPRLENLPSHFNCRTGVALLTDVRGIRPNPGILRITSVFRQETWPDWVN